jgi:phenylacetate-CoA ligase
MWRALVRNIIFPTHEALMGRRTCSIVRALAQTSAMPNVSIARYQRDRVAGLCEHARSVSSYWRERLARPSDVQAPDHAVPTQVAQSLSADCEGPVLTRAEIRRCREAMRCPPLSGKLIHHSSSGTTDDNLVFYLDRQRQAWDRASRIHALQRLGVSQGEKQLHFMPQYPSGARLGVFKDAARSVRDRLTRDPAFDPRPMTPERLDAGLAFLDRYQPALLVGYPSVLFALARRRLESGARRRQAGLRYVLSTGELLYEFQRRAIEAAFDARVVEEYGSQEVGVIASEDASGAWRVNWQHVAVEILRNGRPAHAGETGEIIITSLHSYAMPFIRYATGDVLTVTSHSRMQLDQYSLPRIEGRTSDLLVTTDGRLQSNRELVDLLVAETGVTEFSLHQTAPDHVLCMTLRDRGWIDHEGKVAELLRGLLGRALRIDWRIGTAFLPLKSGKRRYVCSSVAQSILAHDRESGMFLSRAWPQRVLDAA